MKQIITRSFLTALVFFCLHAEGRDRSVSISSDRFFSDLQWDSILTIQVKKVSLKLGAPAMNAELAYQNYQDEIWVSLLPELEKEFEEIEKKFTRESPIGTKRFNNQKFLYLSAIERSVEKTIRGNETLINNIRKVNTNDRILKFNQEVFILKDGTVKVHEKITIYNGNDESAKNTIKRGITRDFPTKYFSRFGFMTNVPFQIVSIQRDGSKESFHLENLKNGVRIYMGQSDQFLKEGIFQYTIEYLTGRQCIFHEDKDEFYWNVTGTGWNFTMDEVTCRVHFPEGSRILESACYTGAQGAKQSECSFQVVKDSGITFQSRNQFHEYEGLTIATSIQKGILLRESGMVLWKQWIHDNWIVVVMIGIDALLLLVYFLTWWRIGRDPQKGVIIPEFNPPSGMSPADVGYALEQKYSPRLFTSAILDMAVQQVLEIEVEKEGLIFKTPVYTFRKKEHQGVDYSGFYTQYGFDPDHLDGEVISKGKYNADIASRYRTLESKLSDRIEVKAKRKSIFSIFSKNDQYIGLGFLVLVLMGIAGLVWIGIHQAPIRSGVMIASFLGIGVVIQIVFMKIMSAYTREGRKLTDQIEGFKLYLSTAERHIYDAMNPPEENLQLFEKFLPYAVALGVENRWSDRFKNQLELAESNGYQPSYYRFSGSSNNSLGLMTSSLASGLSSTVASASTPPSSSSGGSGGGGFSGGGGGGGGGGGW
ncbi:MAG: DUF2207 domain-containing protein [Chitinophagaceae bacterium]|nr:DUF2207 domain-containing protein [Chitinophagaceae bacterium]